MRLPATAVAFAVSVVIPADNAAKLGVCEKTNEPGHVMCRNVWETEQKKSRGKQDSEKLLLKIKFQRKNVKEPNHQFL